MRSQSSYVLDLIDSYHRADATRISFPSLTDHEINHLYESGLASIALRGLALDSGELPEDSYQTLKSADLTARVIYGQLRAATIEILDIASRHEIPVVLLKGISVAEDLYVEPHDRMMGDVDILVPPNMAEDLYQLLIELGYRKHENLQDTPNLEGHHHLPGLRHPESDVFVEVHTSLFSSTAVANQRLFQISTIWDFVEAAEFNGIRCLKFQPEFQLLYTVAHWGIDGKLTVNLISINDVVLLLRREDRPMNWTLIDSWLSDNPLLADYFSVLLLFLNNAGITTVPTVMKERIEASARRIGTINVKVLHWLLSTFPVSGRTKVGWALTSQNARLLWQTLFESRHRSLRLIVAFTRIIFRRNPDKSLLRSTAGRIRTMLAPND